MGGGSHPPCPPPPSVYGPGCNQLTEQLKKGGGKFEITRHRSQGIFFKLAQCRYTLRITSQTSYSPEYTTPTQKNQGQFVFLINEKCTDCLQQIQKVIPSLNQGFINSRMLNLVLV